MMHTRNCKTLHKYLNEDKFDVEMLEKMMLEYFSEETINSTKAILEKSFDRNVTKLR